MNTTETMAPPTHLNGRVVVACIRIETGPGEVPNQWVVVCEDRGAYPGRYVVWLAGYDRAYVASNGDYDLTYDQAVARMIERAGYGEAK